jgi:transposase-like protein
VAGKKIRAYDREMKIGTVKRMLRGENVSALTRELKISRAVLYRWKDAYREEGTGAFRRKAGRPPKFAPGVEKARAAAAGELSAAQQRIAELERKVGQQQVELDFFRQALRQVGEARQPSDRLGVPASTPRSRR